MQIHKLLTISHPGWRDSTRAALILAEARVPRVRCHILSVQINENEASTRPDCLFEISQLAQVTEKIFEEDRRGTIRRLNRAIKYAVDNRFTLKVPKLEKSSLRVIGFSDSSFANNADLSSQVGHICFLGDDSGSVIPITFKSYKAKRITRSAMAGEFIAFSDPFEVA